jgi:hypothetical protein
VKRRKQTTRVTVVTERTRVVGTGGFARTCDLCDGAMVTLNEAAQVSGLPELTLCRLVESRAVHFVESTEGLLFICLESLLTQRTLPD